MATFFTGCLLLLFMLLLFRLLEFSVIGVFVVVVADVVGGFGVTV